MPEYRLVKHRGQYSLAYTGPNGRVRIATGTDERGRAVFEESYLNFLQRLRLRVNVGMPAEGTLLLPNEPILIAAGELAQIQLLEERLGKLEKLLSKE